MKHGVAFRKFSRPTAHRLLMLRNLVTSLIEHEQIKTTLPKARDTARLAEKIITYGKRGDLTAGRKVQGFLLKPTLIPKVFGLLAHRYAQRPGGYTRIHKFGNRPGDNAPVAVVELVDNPRDLRFEMTARAVGWEHLGNKMVHGEANAVDANVDGVESAIRREKNEVTERIGFLKHGIGGRLRRVTRTNLQKVLRYRGELGVRELSERAEKYIERLLAEPVSHIGVRRFVEQQERRRQQISTFESMQEQRLQAGMRRPTSEQSAYSLASGPLRKNRLGLGLSGGWFRRKRLGLREAEREKAVDPSISHP